MKIVMLFENVIRMLDSADFVYTDEYRHAHTRTHSFSFFFLPCALAHAHVCILNLTYTARFDVYFYQVRSLFLPELPAYFIHLSFLQSFLSPWLCWLGASVDELPRLLRSRDRRVTHFRIESVNSVCYRFYARFTAVLYGLLIEEKRFFCGRIKKSL